MLLGLSTDNLTPVSTIVFLSQLSSLVDSRSEGVVWVRLLERDLFSAGKGGDLCAWQDLSPHLNKVLMLCL